MTQREINREIDGRAIATSRGFFRASVGFAAVLATGLTVGLMLGALVAVGSAMSFPVGQAGAADPAGARRATPPEIRARTRPDQRKIGVPHRGADLRRALAPHG